MINFNDVKNYYNDVYYKDAQRHSRPAEHYDIYFKYFKLRPGMSAGRLLDVGCGNGQLIGRALIRGFQVSGIDISEKAVAYARTIYPQCDLRVGTGEKLPWPDQSFDAVVCLGSLEHFLDIPAAIKEMARVCAGTGNLVVMVPNKNFPNWHGTEQQAIKETLLTIEEWESLFRANGLDIVSVYPDRWSGRWILSWKQPLQFFRGLYRRCRAWILPLEKSYQFIFCAVPNKQNSSLSRSFSR